MPATEIKAAALEGTGLDREAAEVYARRIEQLARMMGPDFAEWQVQGMRDWWVGRAYGAVRRAQRSIVGRREIPSGQISRQSTARHGLPRRADAADAAGISARGPGQGKSRRRPMANRWSAARRRQTASGPAPQQDVPTKTGI